MQFGFGIEILLAFERSGNLAPQTIDKGGHFQFEGTALSGRKGQAGGARMVLKIIDVTPIRRGRGRLGQPFDHIPDKGAFSGSDRARYVDVEAGALHLETELQRFHRPLLADGFRRAAPVRSYP